MRYAGSEIRTDGIKDGQIFEELGITLYRFSGGGGVGKVDKLN